MKSRASADRESVGHPPATTKSLVQQLSKRDNRVNWLLLGSDWGIIVLAITAHLEWPGTLVYALVLIILGSRMRALANLLHEAAHYKLFAHRKLNDLVGRILCGWPILVGYSRYVVRHRLHHRNLWRGDLDPDLALNKLTGTEGPSNGRQSFGWFLVKQVLLVAVPVMPLWRLWRDSVATLRGLMTLGLMAVAGVVLTLLGPPIVVTVVVACWIIPWLTTFQSITYWAEIGEHGGLHSLGHYWGSRNWRGDGVSRWLIGSHSDDTFHLLHHWFPSVPHYRLKRLDSACRNTWPEYAAQSRCSGFFLASRTGVSVLRDIWSGGEVADVIQGASLRGRESLPSGIVRPADCSREIG